MHASAAEGGFDDGWSLRRSVSCASCRCRFDAGRATSGDDADCPMCGEIVRLDGLRSEKRRVPRSASTAATGAFGRRRPSRRETRRAIVLVVVFGLIVIGFAALWARFGESADESRSAVHFPR